MNGPAILGAVAETDIIYHMRDGRIYTTELGAQRIKNLPPWIARAKLLGLPIIVCTKEQMLKLDETFDDMKSDLRESVPSE